MVAGVTATFVALGAAIFVALGAPACGPSQSAPSPVSSGEAATTSGQTDGPATNTEASEAASQADEPAAPRVKDVSLDAVGLEAAAMDRKADPCQDFYRFACGGWLDNTTIPDDKARYGRFNEIIDRNETLLRRLLEQASDGKGGDAGTAKLGAFYGACMDQATIDRAGLAGITDLMSAMARVKNARAIPGAINQLHRHGIWAGFSSEPEADFKDSSTNILFIDTAGLGLPDRDYYLQKEKTMVRARTFYRGHVERMFRLAGKSAKVAKRAASDVLRLETELARVTKTKVQRRNLQAMYNKIDRSGVVRLAPRMDWKGYLTALGRPDVEAISVTTPAYLQRLNTLMKTVKPGVWSHYLQWHVLSSMAEALPEKFGEERFALRKELTGQPARAPRWKRCIAATNRALGELLGEQFVAEAFPGKSKEAAASMVREINRAFAAEVGKLSWMSPKTQEQARTKLEKMSRLIGYPDTWRDYTFEVDRQNHAGNVLAARSFEVARKMAKVEKPYDRGEWFMTPQTVNAYYNPLANQMVFPAAILQPPFFGAERGVAANLGAIGMVVGHELTHGFDDMGAQFDGAGNMRNWWQPDDEAAFKAKGQCLVEQYQTFEPIPGVKLNGKLTLGENIADLGGIKLAFRAYRSLRADAKVKMRAEGLDEDQQFFVSVGQAWCTKAREAEVRRRVVVDSHSPPRYRVLGALQNTPEFAEAFGCAEGTPMHPVSTCEVW